MHIATQVRSGVLQTLCHGFQDFARKLLDPIPRELLR